MLVTVMTWHKGLYLWSVSEGKFCYKQQQATPLRERSIWRRGRRVQCRITGFRILLVICLAIRHFLQFSILWSCDVTFVPLTRQRGMQELFTRACESCFACRFGDFWRFGDCFQFSRVKISLWSFDVTIVPLKMQQGCVRILKYRGRLSYMYTACTVPLEWVRRWLML